MASSVQSFLALVAEDLFLRFGTDLANVAVVFPSRRARLFFNNHLYRRAQNPVWAPQYYTIDELFEEMSDLHAADPIKLVCELYKTYTEVYNAHSGKPVEETLDEFFSFGETLLNDFDDVDKHLVNARSLFSNLQDLDVLKDDFKHLSETQKEALSRHFRQTFLGESNLQQAFQSIWSILGEVYTAYKLRLNEQKLSYPGMLMRGVIEKAKENENCFSKYHTYIFAGFNVLNKCEEKLFKLLESKSLFYWDVDSYYVDDKGNALNEAGRFIAGNIRKFGSAVDWKDSGSFLSEEKEITVIASPSENAQASAIVPWIRSLGKSRDFSEPDSAVVLCNEQILPTVMHSIPADEVGNVNITMGFPITQTPISGLLQVLGDLQVKGCSGTSFRYKYVLPVLRHPYIQVIFPEAKEVEKTIVTGNLFFPNREDLKDSGIFRTTKDTAGLAAYLLEIVNRIGRSYEGDSSKDLYDGLYQESVFRAYQILNRLYGLLAAGELQVEKVTFLRLIRKLFSSIQIPFHGEPVKGLQVMGMLETRTLDFDHLILLSVNEGFMPGNANDNTFIPQFLRKHFELSTLEHQDSVYAYYFYRMIQRAKKVTLVYNTDKTQMGKAEMSRFILQLLIDSRLKIKRYSIQTAVKPVQTEVITIPKADTLINKIRAKYDFNTNMEAYSLSPSALNIFIDCPLRFYFQYIEDLRAEEELNDELDSAQFGTIFHKAAELLYRRIGRVGDNKLFDPFPVRREDLEFFLENPFQLDFLVNQAFSLEYFKGRPVEPDQYNGEQLINFRVVRHMLQRLVELDMKRTPFSICGLEYRVYDYFELEGTGIKLKVGGIIDRLEEKDGAYWIIDYKTSGRAKPFKTIEDLVTPKENRASHVFQTFSYASVLMKNTDSHPIVPALLYLQEAGKEDYSPVIQYEKKDIPDYRPLDQTFNESFGNKIAELFDVNIPFYQTSIVSKCDYCDFKNLCNR